MGNASHGSQFSVPAFPVWINYPWYVILFVPYFVLFCIVVVVFSIKLFKKTNQKLPIFRWGWQVLEFHIVKAWSNEDESQGRESQLSLSFDRQLSWTLMNSHALSSTLSWFKFCWESMRGLARLTGHESCTRVDENYKRLNKMADVSERFSDTQENQNCKRCPSHYP